MKQGWRWAWVVGMTLLLSACGGGGGSGGSDSQNAASGNVTLRGSELPLQRSAIQFLDVAGFSVREERYSATVGTETISLARITDQELSFLLPPGLEAGTHRLTVRLGGKQRVLPFEVAPYSLLSRSVVVADLDQLFQKYRAGIDAAVGLMQANGASQAEIDELLASKALLDTESDDVASLTDNELNYLLELLNSLEVEALKQAVAKTLSNPGGFQNTSRNAVTDCPYQAELIKRVVKVAGTLGAGVWLFGAGPLGPIVSAGLVGYAVTEVPGLLATFEQVVSECWIARGAEIVQSFDQRTRSAVSRSDALPVVDSGQQLDFEGGVSQSYQLRVEKAAPEDIARYFARIERIVSVFSALLSGEERAFVEAATSDDYVEFADPAALSLEGITDPLVQGELLALDERRFSLTFSSSQALAEPLDFSLLIRDSLNLLKTRFDATLTATEHCPFVVSGGHDVVPMADKCIVIEHPDADSRTGYLEYQNGAVVLTEIFESGSTDLKSLKGLGAYPQVGAYSVQTPPYWHEKSAPFSDGEGYYYSVPSYRETHVSGVREEMDYSAPYIGFGGSWSSSPLQQRTYYPNGDYAQYDYAVVTGWGSVFKTDLWSSAGGSREIVYTAPLEEGAGWASVPEYRLDYAGRPGSQLISKEQYTTINSGGFWSYYTRRIDYYLDGCYVTYSQSGDIVVDTCSPPAE